MTYRHCLALTLVTAVLTACGGGQTAREAPDQTRAIGVNGLLWRASLDTVSFLPLVEVDSSSGVIVSDWYVNPDAPDERLKVSVFVLDQSLRADAVKVTVLRQTQDRGNWINAPVQAQTELEIEEAILTRARQIRIQSLDG